MKALLFRDELSEAIRAGLEASRSVCMAYALVSLGGIDSIKEALHEFLKKGGKAKLLIGVDLPTSPEALDELVDLRDQYKGQIDLKRFQSSENRIFHPKLIIFNASTRTSSAIVGSSNLTHGGLAQNWEANIQVSGSGVEAFSGYFDELFDGGYARELDDKWLSRYRRLWAERNAAKKTFYALRRKVRSIGSKRTDNRVPARIMGSIFAFTGKIDEFPRKGVLYPMIRKYKGDFRDSEKGMGRVNCLVHAEILGGRESTQKLERARELRIPIISQEEFFRMVDREVHLRKRNK